MQDQAQQHRYRKIQNIQQESQRIAGQIIDVPLQTSEHIMPRSGLNFHTGMHKNYTVFHSPMQDGKIPAWSKQGSQRNVSNGQENGRQQIAHGNMLIVNHVQPDANDQ